MLTWLIVALIVLAVGAIIALFVYLERKRAQKLVASARRLGFTLRAKAAPEDKALVADSDLATTGKHRAMRNVIEVPAWDDEQMVLFDYSYVVGTGKSSHTVDQTVVRVRSPKLKLPAFYLRPESMFSKVAQKLGYKDIDFPQWPTFSAKYLLRGPDEAAIRQLFTPSLIHYFEEHRGLVVEGAEDHLLFYREGRRIKPEDLEAFVNEGRRITALFIA